MDEIDLILGGHDHVYEKQKVNGKYILKSGTDFRNFSAITLDFSEVPEGEGSKEGEGEEKKAAEGEKSGRAKVEVEMVEVTAEAFPNPDEELAKDLEKYTGKEREKGRLFCKEKTFLSYMLLVYDEKSSCSCCTYSDTTLVYDAERTFENILAF